MYSPGHVEVGRVDTGVDNLQGNPGTTFVDCLHQSAQTRYHIITVDTILMRQNLAMLRNEGKAAYYQTNATLPKQPVKGH
jgi:hypothetical protein